MVEVKLEEVLFTGALGTIIEQNRGKLGDQVTQAMSEIIFFSKKILNAADKVSEVKKLYKLIDRFQKEIDPQRQQEITCRKGCAFCCHIEVSLGDLEKDVMMQYVERRGIKYNTKRLEAQLHHDEHELAVSDDSRCVFLGHDNTCNVYDARPMACRKYLVISDPKLCDAKKYPGNKAAIHFHYKTEILASAILTASKKMGTMAQMLLDKKIVNGEAVALRGK